MTTAAIDKDQPLKDDIRLLGRILGDTVRDQHGARIFDIIEHVRQLSVSFRRDDDQNARWELSHTLNGLTL